MKLYIAGKFSEKSLIKEAMISAINDGHTITHDWTLVESEQDDRERLSSSSVRDIKAVQDCECLLIMFTDVKYAYRGTFTELGCALGLNKKVIIISTSDSKDAY